mgnify:CR=1 FL=1
MTDIPGHLDIGFEDFPSQMMAIGKVTAVFAKDHAQNITGKITTYQVEIMLQRPALVSIPSGQMTAQGQFGGGGCEYERPFTVGQFVSVGFFEGDGNRAVILGAYADIAGTQGAQTEAQHPRFRWDWQGTQVEVSKDGAASVQIPSGQQLEIQDSSGSVLLVVKEDGSIQIGGTVGLDKLLRKAFGTSLASAFTAAAATLLVPEPVVSGVFTTLATSTTSNTSSNSTLQTEAK